jgi:glyoxylase-like metal-dependent hydrolase (beta-lactamase superfamily II)
VVIRLHDILFSGDHVLEHTSPHQSPERLTLSTGLDHYLKSLESLRQWAGGVRLTLAGHEAPIKDLPALDAIREVHARRLQKVLELLAEPLTLVEYRGPYSGKFTGATCCWRWRRQGRMWNTFTNARPWD